MQVPGELLEAGCDYLTVTARERDGADKLSGGRLLALAEVDLLRERGRGNELVRWKGEGYEGFKSGAIHYGTRDDGAIVRLSSHLARERYIAYMEQASNCSRIDWQFTVMVPSYKEGFIKKLHGQVYRWHEHHDTRREVRLIDSKRRGQTLQIGERTSESHGRIYDKHRESKGAYDLGAVRLEMEWKGDRSLKIKNHMLRSKTPDHDGALILRQDLIRRGVSCLNSHELAQSRIGVNLRAQKRQSTTDLVQAREWMRRQCS